MSKAKDYRDQPIEELEAIYEDTRKQLFQLKNKIRREKKVDKPHLFQEMRRDVARILTIINEKRLAAQ